MSGEKPPAANCRCTIRPIELKPSEVKDLNIVKEYFEDINKAMYREYFWMMQKDLPGIH